MGMFTGYDTLQNNYIPNNLPNCPAPDSKLTPICPNKPYVDYDINGNVQGYWWYYGDTVNLEFNISGESVYEGEPEVTGNTITSGTTNIEPTEDGNYIDIMDFLADKQILIQLYNFRQEELAIDIPDSCTNGCLDKEIIKKTFGTDQLIKNKDGSVSLVFGIDKNLSQAMVKGVYFISLKIISNDLQDTLFQQSDAILTVK